MPKLYQEFMDIFAKESFDELPDWKQRDHNNKLVLDAQTFSTMVYPLAPTEQNQLYECLDKNLKNGVVCGYTVC